MAYSEDYGRRAVEYYHEGHTQAEVQIVFKVHPKTLIDADRLGISHEKRQLEGNVSQERNA